MSVLTWITDIAQVMSPVLYAAFIVVIYFQLRAARESVREVRQEFLAAGRPVVAVHDEYDHDSDGLSIAVENVGQGPAKHISFAFSRPIESSDGVVISDLPLFTIGLTSLAPGARLTCYWDDLHAQLDLLKRQDLAGSDFEVTVRYLDLPGTSYSNTWDIQPAVYEGLRAPPHPEAHVTDQAGESAGSEPTAAAGVTGRER
ncbi:MAG TPA: hypothetical protein VGH76_27615 [Actinomycetospora sp.]|jgi:hypothetical protein|uniref:hypothetical protein n=1 Tax=Actinomycetospora sp. TaxID=1872135 RepID=UPI002F3FC123